MFAKTKVFRVGEVTENLCKQVTELESKMMPSTPLEVLEERKKATTEAVQNMEEVKVLCAKAVEKVSQPWESLIDNIELEQVTEQLHTAEVDFTQLKNEVKKLSVIEKMVRVADMKKITTKSS